MSTWEWHFAWEVGELGAYGEASCGEHDGEEEGGEGEHGGEEGIEDAEGKMVVAERMGWFGDRWGKMW